jgi:hypothetical protein
MIRAQAGDVFMLVIEPGNIDRLKAQKPIKIEVPQGTKHLLVYYSPDVEFMAELIAKGVPFSEAFEASLGRPEVHERPNNKPEPQFKNVKLSGEQA